MQRRRQRHHLLGLAVARPEPRHRVRDAGDRADRHRRWNKIALVQGDTAVVPKGGGTNASKSLQAGGSAVYVAAGKVVDQAREFAADLLEAGVDDVVLDKVAGAASTCRARRRRHVSWAEVVEAAGADGLDRPTTDDVLAGSSFPFGTHLVVVELDTETGRIEVQRVVTCDDCGTILNPNLVEGQRHGGIAQGIAQALLEEVRYDDDGNPRHQQLRRLRDHLGRRAAELRAASPLETPTPNNPLGAKGIGESGAIGSTPALQSAVCDALAPFGVRHIDIPVTAEKVWAAISARA